MTYAIKGYKTAHGMPSGHIGSPDALDEPI